MRYLLFSPTTPRLAVSYLLSAAHSSLDSQLCQSTSSPSRQPQHSKIVPVQSSPVPIPVQVSMLITESQTLSEYLLDFPIQDASELRAMFAADSDPFLPRDFEAWYDTDVAGLHPFEILDPREVGPPSPPTSLRDLGDFDNAPTVDFQSWTEELVSADLEFVGSEFARDDAAANVGAPVTLTDESGIANFDMLVDFINNNSGPSPTSGHVEAQPPTTVEQSSTSPSFEEITDPIATPEWQHLFEWFLHHTSVDTSSPSPSPTCNSCSACLFLCTDLDPVLVASIARDLDRERVSAVGMMSLDEIEALMELSSKSGYSIFEGGVEGLTQLLGKDEERADFGATGRAVECVQGRGRGEGKVGLAIRLRHK